MQLELNVTAPVFKMIDIFDREIDLTNYKGKKVLIAFFRHVGCPFCNLRIHNLMKHHEEFKAKNFEMIFFFESNKTLLLKSIFHKELSPIPLIADPEKKWYSIYGLEESAYKSAMSHLTTFIQTAIKAKLKSLPLHPMAGGESIKTMPAEFLLDEKLIIRRLLYSQNLNDRMAINDIIDFIEK